MPRGLFHKFRCFRPVASPSAWAIGASLRGSRTRQAGLCLPAGGMARLAHMVNDVLAESGAFELGGVIMLSFSRWLLLGEAVERAKTPNQAGRAEAGDRPAGGAFAQNEERALVVVAAIGRDNAVRPWPSEPSGGVRLPLGRYAPAGPGRGVGSQVGIGGAQIRAVVFRQPPPSGGTIPRATTASRPLLWHRECARGWCCR